MNLDTEEKLLQLLRIGLGCQDVDEEECKRLFSSSIAEWKDIKDAAFLQSVHAIAFDGLQKIYEKHWGDLTAPDKNPSEWKQLLLEWGAITLQTERSNRKQQNVIKELASVWEESSINTLIFKGQACGSFYPEPTHRAVGDIDCYLFGNADKGDKIIAERGANVERKWYRHSKIHYMGETIENHVCIGHTRSGKKSKKQNDEFIKLAFSEENKQLHGCGCALKPSMLFDACFLTYHAMIHFLLRGFCLKHILDWAMFLKNAQRELDWRNFYGFCERYNLRRFADAMTCIAVERIGIVVTNPDVVTKSEYADKILNSALYVDANAQEVDTGSWKGRMHTVKQMLTEDRWKYKKIAQQSVIKVLYMNTIGFFMKREED